MSCQPDRQCEDAQGRVGLAGSGKHRTARHVEILDAMHLAVGIDNALARIGRHPGCAYLMKSVAGLIQYCGAKIGEPVDQLAAPMVAQMGIEQTMSADDAVRIGLRESQVHDRTPHAENVRFPAEANVAFLRGPLLGVIVQGVQVAAALDEKSRHATFREESPVNEGRREGHDGR